MKYYGKIGFVYTVEEPAESGIWVEKKIEKPYYGDILKPTRRWENTEDINKDLIVTNELSIMADPFLYEHYSNIRFVEFLGTNWQVNSIQIDRPRLTLTLGGLYNG